MKETKKTTVLLDSDLWNRFRIQMHVRRNTTSRSKALEIAMKEWLDSLPEAHSTSNSPVTTIPAKLPARSDTMSPTESTLEAISQKLTLLLNLVSEGEIVDQKKRARVGANAEKTSPPAANLVAKAQSARLRRKGIEASTAGDQTRKNGDQQKTGSA